MKNLAAVTHDPSYSLAEGIKKTEKEICHELSISGVPVVSILPKDRGEIQSSVGGKLGDFRFFRAWYYWVVLGNFPIKVAQEIWETEVGKKDIRAGGDCGPVAPEGYVVSWLAPDGRKIINLSEKESADRYILDGVFTQEEVDARWLFAKPEDFARLGEQYVTCYHVDSQQGLNLLLEIMRKHRLV